MVKIQHLWDIAPDTTMAAAGRSRLLGVLRPPRAGSLAMTNVVKRKLIKERQTPCLVYSFKKYLTPTIEMLYSDLGNLD